MISALKKYEKTIRESLVPSTSFWTSDSPLVVDEDKSTLYQRWFKNSLFAYSSTHVSQNVPSRKSNKPQSITSIYWTHKWQQQQPPTTSLARRYYFYFFFIPKSPTINRPHVALRFHNKKRIAHHEYHSNFLWSQMIERDKCWQLWPARVLFVQTSLWLSSSMPLLIALFTVDTCYFDTGLNAFLWRQSRDSWVGEQLHREAKGWMPNFDTFSSCKCTLGWIELQVERENAKALFSEGVPPCWIESEVR